MNEADQQRALSVDELREVDRRATEEFGIAGVLLMENAGCGAARVASKMLEEAAVPADVTSLVLCGGGGNGGDGYVLARHLALAGRRVLVIHAAVRSGGDAGSMRRVVARMELEQVRVTNPVEIEAFLRDGYGGRIERGEVPCALIVDALLGTGSRSAPRGSTKSLLEFSLRVLERRRGVTTEASNGLPLGLALDLPSGLDADSGKGLGGPVFPADCTATFVAPKLGFARAESRQWTGRVEVCSIGAP